MELEWTVTYSQEIPESTMDEMVAGVADEGWTKEMVYSHLENVVVSGWDDVFFYTFNDEAYEKVWQEVMRRVNHEYGQQLKMEGV